MMFVLGFIAAGIVLAGKPRPLPLGALQRLHSRISCYLPLGLVISPIL
jgi:hypothetical protein